MTREEILAVIEKGGYLALKNGHGNFVFLLPEGVGPSKVYAEGLFNKSGYSKGAIGLFFSDASMREATETEIQQFKETE